MGCHRGRRQASRWPLTGRRWPDPRAATDHRPVSILTNVRSPLLQEAAVSGSWPLWTGKTADVSEPGWKTKNAKRSTARRFHGLGGGTMPLVGVVKAWLTWSTDPQPTPMTRGSRPSPRPDPRPLRPPRPKGQLVSYQQWRKMLQISCRLYSDWPLAMTGQEDIIVGRCDVSSQVMTLSGHAASQRPPPGGALSHMVRWYQ